METTRKPAQSITEEMNVNEMAQRIFYDKLAQYCTSEETAIIGTVLKDIEQLNADPRGNINIKSMKDFIKTEYTIKDMKDLINTSALNLACVCLNDDYCDVPNTAPIVSDVCNTLKVLQDFLSSAQA